MSIEKNVEQFDSLPYITKLQAVGALDREGDKHKRLKPIYDKVETHGTKIINIWELGPYVFVEAKGISKNKEDVYFGGIFDGKRVNRWSYTLEEAILETFGIKFDGINSQAGEMMARMLKINTPEK